MTTDPHPVPRESSIREFGLDVAIATASLDFQYGPGVVGPTPEKRSLDAIRKSLLDPKCSGPAVVYSIAMDVAKETHRETLQKRMLLFGIVAFSSGRLGVEPVRSQGHVHRVSAHSGWSPPEVYEIWQGKAVIYMQENARKYPGRCFAVTGEAGDVIMVPPGWAHATISSDPNSPLIFGAWCDREYGFDYDDIRKLHGLAWYPLSLAGGSLNWMQNPNYEPSILIQKSPESYSALGLEKGVPIYRQFETDPDRFRFVSQPQSVADFWRDFVP